MRRRLNLIQASRAIVPILVMLFHISDIFVVKFNYNFMGISEVPRSGGVDFFFVLTGFMIYYVYQGKIGSRDMFKKYSFGRVVRIFPIYWVMSIPLILVYFIVPSFGEEYTRELSYIISSIFLLPQVNPPIIPVAWSLTYNLVFYIWFSLLFLFNKKTVHLIFFSWALINILFVFIRPDFYLTNLFLSKYNLYFLFGVLTAHFIVNYKIKPLKSFVFIGVLGFPLTWILVLFTSMDVPVEPIYLVFSVLLILGLSSIDMNKMVKIPKAIDYLGNASFSIYLSHVISILVFTKVAEALDLFNKIGGAFLGSLMMIGALIGGCIIHSYIEKPLTKVLTLKIINNKKKILVENTDNIAIRNAN